MGMIAVTGYTLASAVFLLAIYLIERQPSLSRDLFLASAALYLAVGVSLLGSGTSALRFVLIGSVLWHGWSCYAGWRRHYARVQLQYRLLRSFGTLAAINLILYLIVLFDFADFERLFDGAAFAGALLIMPRTVWGLRSRTVGRYNKPLRDLPTVSLLIPARNEDHALTDCLNSALTIDYPRLEIIVVDDCSHDRTPEIIRGFAHEGVRFISTDRLPDDWLGKNHALHRLAQEASGDLLLFADADIRFMPSAVTQMVSDMENRSLTMLSVMPQRPMADLWPNLLASLLPWWQLLIPVGLFGQQPVSAACYAIERKAYERIGGHGAFRAAILPERFFAHLLRRQYRFAVSDSRLGISTRKRLASQLETQQRTYYPLVNSSPGAVLGWLLAAATLLLYPVASAIFHGSRFGFASWALIALSLFAYNRRLQPANSWLGFFQLPLAVILEMAQLTVSMIRYEIAGVTWKERNVCYPQLIAYSRLPSLSD
jgi:hypothetical protein